MNSLAFMVDSSIANVTRFLNGIPFVVCFIDKGVFVLADRSGHVLLSVLVGVDLTETSMFFAAFVCITLSDFRCGVSAICFSDIFSKDSFFCTVAVTLGTIVLEAVVLAGTDALLFGAVGVLLTGGVGSDGELSGLVSTRDSRR